MKEIVMKNAELDEMRRLTDIGCGIKVEGKNKTHWVTPYFEEIRWQFTLEEVKEIYERHGFKVIHTA